MLSITNNNKNLNIGTFIDHTLPDKLNEHYVICDENLVHLKFNNIAIAFHSYLEHKYLN